MKNKKTVFLIISACIILLLICTVIFLVINNNSSSTKEDNNDTSVYEEVVINDLEFKIDEINYDGEFSDIKIKVKNNSEKDYNLGNVKLIFKDKDSNEIGEVLTSSVGNISLNDSFILVTSIDVDLRDATTVDYVLLGGNNNE